MDAIIPSVDEGDAETALRQAILSVKLALETFEEVILQIGTLDVDVTDIQATKAINRLRDSFVALNRERQRFEAEAYGKTGPIGAEPIDIGAARAEVGRLLARLRADRGAGGVSGEPEP